MLEELDELIKTDELSQEKFKSFKTSFAAEKEQLSKSALKRARITALVLGGAMVLSLFFLLFAFVTKINAEEEKIKFETQIHQLEQKLEDCVGLRMK